MFLFSFSKLCFCTHLGFFFKQETFTMRVNSIRSFMYLSDTILRCFQKFVLLPHLQTGLNRIGGSTNGHFISGVILEKKFEYHKSISSEESHGASPESRKIREMGKADINLVSF